MSQVLGNLWGILGKLPKSSDLHQCLWKFWSFCAISPKFTIAASPKLGARGLLISLLSVCGFCATTVLSTMLHFQLCPRTTPHSPLIPKCLQAEREPLQCDEK
ncbi:unnamed protein product [Schistosoma haematobium]|nr:unnamed protein product [Schistosoma haematobium]CAH8660383.1 unnamed protein product [Schistosoma haematobium]